MSHLNYNYESCFSTYLQRFVEFKRLQGYDYSSQAQRLTLIDKFAQQLEWASPCLSHDFFFAYEETLTHLSLRSRHARLRNLCVFSKFLHQCESESEIYTIPFRRPKGLPGYVYTTKETKQLLTAAINLKPEIRAHSLTTMISLMAVTGLRPSETINLRVEDFDSLNRTLFIRNSKQGKDRIIPIANSTAKGLVRYLNQRHSLDRNKPIGSFLLSRPGKPLVLRTAQLIFRKLCRAVGIDHPKRQPRLHDWRYTFVHNCLVRWYLDDVNVNARLSVLATYLGHVGVTETQVYLQTTPELMASSCQRFSEYIDSNGEQYQKEASHDQ